MSDKKELKMNIGGGSVILILLIFALSIFAVLSIKASNNELSLAKKTKASVEEYYNADRKATELLSQIHKKVKSTDFYELEWQLPEFKEISQVFMNEDGKVQVDYDIKVNEKATLSVSLLVSQDTSYKIIRWKVIQEDQGEFDFGIETEELWDGSIEE